MEIKEALAALSPDNADLWTTDGQPMVDAVAAIVGSAVTRAEITDADPAFSRDVARLMGDGSGADAAPAATPAVATEEIAEGEPTDAELSATVEIVDDVVAMDMHDVFADADLLERARVEFGRQSELLAARVEACKAKLADVGRRGAMIDKQLDMMGRGQTKNPAKQIQAYLKQQAKNRAEKAERAQAFLKSGTNAADVKEQLTTKSPLDAALAQQNK